MLLLRDLRTVFASVGDDRLWSTVVIDELLKLEGSPWNEVRRGKPLTARGLATRLSAFGISTTNIRVGELVRKGYLAKDCADAFDRYLDVLPPTPQGTAI